MIDTVAHINAVVLQLQFLLVVSLGDLFDDRVKYVLKIDVVL